MGQIKKGFKFSAAIQTCIFIVLWTVFFLYTSGNWFLISQPNDEILSVSHHKYNFAVDYPSQYVARKYENGYRRDRDRKLLIMKTVQDDLYIEFLQKEQESATLEDVLEWRNDRFPFARNGIHDPDTLVQPMQLSKYDAWFIDRVSSNGRFLREVYILRERDMFIIEFEAHQSNVTKYEADFEFILRSFRSVEEQE